MVPNPPEIYAQKSTFIVFMFILFPLQPSSLSTTKFRRLVLLSSVYWFEHDYQVVSVFLASGSFAQQLLNQVMICFFFEAYTLLEYFYFILWSVLFLEVYFAVYGPFLKDFAR